MRRRTFLKGSLASAGLWSSTGYAASEDRRAVRMMSWMDVYQHEPVAARGQLGLTVLEDVRQLSQEEQSRPEFQRVMHRASLWVGEALDAVRTSLRGLARGHEIDEDALGAALDSVEGLSLAQCDGLAVLRDQLHPARRVRAARRMSVRLERAHHRAERMVADGRVPDISWMAGSVDLQRVGGKNLIEALISALLLIALIVLLTVVAVVVIGGIVILVGASTGQLGVVIAGVVLILAAVVLLIVVFLDRPVPMRHPPAVAGAG